MLATPLQLEQLRRLKNAQKAAGKSKPGGHDPLLGMQQAVGNQAMQQLLAAQMSTRDPQGSTSQGNAAWWGRDWIRRALQPRHFQTGKALQGPYKLWSGSGYPGSGFDAAKAAPGGYMLHDLKSNQQVLDKLTEMGYPNPDLAPWDKAKPLWEGASIKEAVRAGSGEIPVASHGLNTHRNPAGTVQSRVELPWVARSALLPSALMKASGVMNILAGIQSDTALEKIAGVAGGTAEIVGGSTYLVGQAAANPAIAQLGSKIGNVGGGGALGILSAHQFARDVEKGNWQGAIGSGTSTASGLLTAGATLAGSAGLTAAGSVLGAFSAGYGVVTLINNYVLPESWKEKIGEGVYNAVKFLGFNVD
ncbi:MAG TPA: hypothetical protein VK464_01955 [Symbiobacteriaceae bacterium]|nr:hypothetical protein [Symbiobacteriaceae bacterium]